MFTNSTRHGSACRRKRGRRASLFSAAGERLESRRMLAAGDLDPSFGAGGKVTEFFVGTASHEARAIAIDPQGRTVVVGTVVIASPLSVSFGVMRLLSDGSLDPTFGSSGKVVVPFTVNNQGSRGAASSVAIDSVGRIVVAGMAMTAATGYDFAVARLSNDGKLDKSFGGDGTVTVGFNLAGGGTGDEGGTAVAVDPGGRVVVAGLVDRGMTNGLWNRDFGVVRLTSAGALDSTFDGDGRSIVSFDSVLPKQKAFDDMPSGVVVDTAGRIVVVGKAADGAALAVARLTSAGTLDTTFAKAGRLAIKQSSGFSVGAAAIDAKGRIVISAATAGDCAVFRVTPQGKLDKTFDGDGKAVVGFNLGGGKKDEARSLAIDANGRIVVGALAERNGNDKDFGVFRLSSAGKLDKTFGKATKGRVVVPFNLGGNAADVTAGLAIDAAGRIVVAGTVARDSRTDMAVVRFLG